MNGPVKLIRLGVPFGAAPPDLTATSRSDRAPIGAEFVLDWGSGGNATPFATPSSDVMDIPLSGTGAGKRRQIVVGAEVVDVSGLPSDLLIEQRPRRRSSRLHMRLRRRWRISLAKFVTARQGELNGTTVATTISA